MKYVWVVTDMEYSDIIYYFTSKIKALQFVELEKDTDFDVQRRKVG